MADREKLLKKVQALLSITLSNGATENEALVAAQKARKLMDEHDINLTETLIREEAILSEEFMTEGRYHTSAARLMMESVSMFTDTQIYRRSHTPQNMGTITYINVVGQPGDVKFALWLMDMLSNFVLRGIETHGGSQTSRLAFAQGASIRIAARLKEAALLRKGASNSRALVLAKDYMIEDFLKRKGVSLGDESIKKADDLVAYLKGRAHGEHAQWSKPVEQQDKQRSVKNG